jgi:hypothetical protein
MANDFLPTFFTMQDHRLRGAQPWLVPNYGHECFAELVKAVGSREDLLSMARSGEWSDAVLDAFCLHCGIHRGLYDPLDQFGKNPPKVWKTRWIAEFVDWYVKKNAESQVEAEEQGDELEPVAEVKKRRGRPRKSVEVTVHSPEGFREVHWEATSTS